MPNILWSNTLLWFEKVSYLGDLSWNFNCNLYTMKIKSFILNFSSYWWDGKHFSLWRKYITFPLSGVFPIILYQVLEKEPHQRRHQLYISFFSSYHFPAKDNPVPCQWTNKQKNIEDIAIIKEEYFKNYCLCSLLCHSQISSLHVVYWMKYYY